MGPGPDGLLVLVADRVLTPYRRLEPGFVALRGTRIAAVANGDPPTDALARAERVVELGDSTVAPGFIDLHVHGGGGADAMDGTTEAFATMARQHAAGGTTAFLPTTVCAPLEQITAVAEAHRRFQLGASPGARSLGLHLEGPYLAPGQAGALDPALMRTPAQDDLEAWFDTLPELRRMTLAPELPGARRLLRLLRERGVLVSLGHADPRPDDLAAAVEDGATLVTHLWSGMRGVARESAYRVAGLVEMSLLFDALAVELIADGAHLPPELLRLALRRKGAGRVALVTDAMRAAGLGPGRYRLGGAAGGEVLVEDGVAKLPDRSAFAGSVASMDLLVRTLVTTADASLADAVEMASTTPARLLGAYDRKGTLAPGKDADVTVLGPDLRARMTVVAGRVVYEADAPTETTLQEA
jgi:N-acetylglucosamine-6-phosphate deacetylase